MQTAHDLHTLPEMGELNGFFMNGVGEVLDTLAMKHTEMEITGCWANIHSGDFPHRPHSHSNNFLSAVYYVEAPQGCNKISFEDPRIQPSIMYPPVKELNRYTAEYAEFEVVDGLLLLFPSWLVHSVPPGTNKARRISIAFNVNFTDFSARISPPLWEANVPTHP